MQAIGSVKVSKKLNLLETFFRRSWVKKNGVGPNNLILKFTLNILKLDNLILKSIIVVKLNK